MYFFHLEIECHLQFISDKDPNSKSNISRRIGSVADATIKIPITINEFDENCVIKEYDILTITGKIARSNSSFVFVVESSKKIVNTGKVVEEEDSVKIVRVPTLLPMKVSNNNYLI